MGVFSVVQPVKDIPLDVSLLYAVSGDLGKFLDRFRKMWTPTS